MADVAAESPFGEEQIPEVPLAAAPLVRVLSQVRFPRLTALAAGGETAHAFATAMEPSYPILTEQHEVAVTITPEGVTQAPSTARVWQLRSADELWQVTFGDTFLAVDTAAYSSRGDFAARLVAAWQIFVEVVQPPFVERVGVRYINRIDDPAVLADLPALVRPEALGGVGVALQGGVRLGHSMHEALYHLDDLDGLQARWGMLPQGAVLDPTLPPVPGPCWVLDLDAFHLGRQEVAPEEVGQNVRRLGERAYRYFRWVVTSQFLARFRGEDR